MPYLGVACGPLFFGDYYDIYFRSGRVLGSNQLPGWWLHRQGGDIHSCRQNCDNHYGPLGGVLAVPAVRPGAGRQSTPDSAPLMRFPLPQRFQVRGDSVGRGGTYICVSQV